jgi:acyl-CoA synthetase (AMP-forming)/AMP-acid ligase II
MLWPIERFGTLRDLSLALAWDGPALAREAARRAHWLASLVVGSGSRVAILHAGSAHFFADLFAVWSLGATAMPLDPALTDPELETLFTFAAPVAVLVRSDHHRRSPALPYISLEYDESAFVPARLTGPAKPSDPALILFTSGTTGVPKGVVLSFEAIATRIALNVERIGPAALHTTVLTLPVHFVAGLIGNCLTPLMGGSDLVIPEPGLSLASTFGQIADEHGATLLTGSPAFWRLVLKLSPRPRRGTLARTHLGAAPVSAELWREIAEWTGCEVANLYGMTET